MHGLCLQLLWLLVYASNLSCRHLATSVWVVQCCCLPQPCGAHISCSDSSFVLPLDDVASNCNFALLQHPSASVVISGLAVYLLGSDCPGCSQSTMRAECRGCKSSSTSDPNSLLTHSCLTSTDQWYYHHIMEAGVASRPVHAFRWHKRYARAHSVVGCILFVIVCPQCTRCTLIHLLSQHDSVATHIVWCFMEPSNRCHR